MSDTPETKTASSTTDALLRRISELEASVAKANGDAKKYRLRLRDEEKAHGELKTAHGTLTKEHDDLKTKSTQTPDEWKAKHDDLQGKLRARDARDEWAKVLGPDALRDKVTIEKLWRDLEYTPGEAVPTPEEIAEQVTKARESVPYLFNDKAETATNGSGEPTKVVKPPLKETDATRRGAPDKTSSRVTVSRSQLQDPKWKLDPQNKEMLTDATKRGVLDIVDG
jgi:hypothetical protein